jgi:hypothetical protein
MICRYGGVTFSLLPFFSGFLYLVLGLDTCFIPAGRVRRVAA